ncbi:non-ribosomal peptide synthetase [Undibacterium sp. TJN19]|uniref:non-ribosomal peptide synthetase n=1 Tax=Undibacterium sp. TJN19 TaxID=3413055 RepID=UPI003BF1345F
MTSMDDLHKSIDSSAFENRDAATVAIAGGDSAGSKGNTFNSRENVVHADADFLREPCVKAIDEVADIIERFKFSAHQYRDRNAIEFGEQIWSYQQLDGLSDDLARLIQNRSDHQHSVVVIHCERSPLLVLAILACVKANRVFFVIGENQPEAYISRALESVKNIFWLGSEGYSDEEKARRITDERLSDCCILSSQHMDDSGTELDGEYVADQATEIDESDYPDAIADREMYLVATSGTTGKPKLVVTSVRPILNFMDWYQEKFSLSVKDKFSMLSGLGYDPLIRDIFVPLTIGACIAIPTREALSSRHGLHAWIKEKQVTVVHATPQLARHIFEQSEKQGLDTLRLLAIGGSVLGQELASHIKSLLPSGTLINVYGTSETPQIMTCQVVADTTGTAAQSSIENVPVGKPIRQVDIQILKEDGGLAGEFEVGEIHIVTPHLARGYYLNPELTAEKFLVNEEGNCRSYRTGDLGFIDRDGNLNYIGRKDRQVKSRGYRIQLEEIEQAVQSLDAVFSAAAIHEGAKGAEKLVCYVQSKSGAQFNLPDIKQRLVDILPTYMMPDSYVPVEKMPLNSRHKIDYSALKQAVSATALTHAAQTGPVVRDHLVAKELLSIWAGVLDAPKANIAMDSNFFDVGGNSLLSVKLIELINKTFSKKLKTTDLFVYSNIHDLSRFIEAKNDDHHHLDSTVNVSKRAKHLSQVNLERNRRIRVEL